MTQDRKAHQGLRPATATRSSPLDEAVKLVKANATAKFDETVEIAVNLGVDPRHADQKVRGVVSLPSGTGRTCASPSSPRTPRPTKPRAAGADIVGAEDLVERIQGGFMDFDRVHRHPGHDGPGRPSG